MISALARLGGATAAWVLAFVVVPLVMVVGITVVDTADEPGAGEPVVEQGPKGRVSTVKVVQSALRFNNNRDQQVADVRRTFQRGSHVIMGSEAGPKNPAYRDIPKIAGANGYTFIRHDAEFIAVKKDWGKITSTKWTPVPQSRGILSVVVDAEELGPLTVATAHWLKQGQWHVKMSQAMADVVQAGAKGEGWAIWGGDANAHASGNNPALKTVRDRGLTVAWADVGRFPPTRKNPHGNTIDWIGRANQDCRVTTKRIQRITKPRPIKDHFDVEARFKVRTTEAGCPK